MKDLLQDCYVSVKGILGAYSIVKLCLSNNCNSHSQSVRQFSLINKLTQTEKTGKVLAALVLLVETPDSISSRNSLDSVTV